MDRFKQLQMKTIGPGGFKCRCCNDFHRWGSHQKKLNGLSKLTRTRLKNLTQKEVRDEQ